MPETSTRQPRDRVHNRSPRCTIAAALSEEPYIDKNNGYRCYNHALFSDTRY